MVNKDVADLPGANRIRATTNTWLTKVSRDKCIGKSSASGIHTLGGVSLYLTPKPSNSVGSDAGCQSTGYEFEPQLGQHSFRRLTN